MSSGRPPARLLLVPLLLAACASAGARPPADAGPLRVLHFGDFGEGTPSQRAVADAMAAEARRAPVDLALHAGDNVYECGVDPRLPGASACAFAADGNAVAGSAAVPADPQFAEKFEEPLRGLLRDGQPVPTWLVLGNHDVHARGECAAGPDPAAVARTKACLQVAHRSPRWTMPGRHWVLDRGPARFVGIDSNLLKGDYGGFTIDGEVALVKEAFSGCEARTCFLVAHHPSFSAGEHRADATPEYLRRVALVEGAAGGRMAAWLAGHEHQLEHLRSPSGYDVLVSAATARPRPGEPFSPLSAPGATLLWASSTPGFAVLEVRRDGWSHRFLDAAGHPLHCCEASGRGACRPTSCAP